MLCRKKAGHLKKDSRPVKFHKQLILNIGHKREMTGSLDRYGKRSLMLCTVAGDPSGKDLSSLGYVSF